jgi:hypothetical protein
MGLFSDSAILAILAEKFLTLKYYNNALFSQKFFSHIFQSKIDFKIFCANPQKKNGFLLARGTTAKHEEIFPESSTSTSAT